MAETTYGLLTKELKIKPEEDEAEQAFYKRVVVAGDKLSEKKFEALPDVCRDWLDEATTAVKEKTAIPGMQGAPFDDDNEDETDPSEEEEDENEDTESEDEEETETAEDDDETTDDEEDKAPKRGRGRPAKTAAKPAEKEKAKAAPAVAKKGKAAAADEDEDEDEDEEEAEPAPKKSAKVAKGKSGTKARDEAPDPKKAKAAVAAKADNKAKRKNKVLKIGRQRSTDGVLYKLLEAMYEDPTRNVAELVRVVEAENKSMKIKKSNAIGIRQQYRRIVFFLQDKGDVKGLIKAGAAD